MSQSSGRIAARFECLNAELKNLVELHQKLNDVFSPVLAPTKAMGALAGESVGEEKCAIEEAIESLSRQVSTIRLSVESLIERSAL